MSVREPPSRSLFDLDEPNPTNLFFAVEPPATVVSEISDAARRIGQREGLERPRPTNVLHMTIGWFGPYQDLERAIDLARRVGDAVIAARFDIELTRLMHFGGGAVVLAPSETPAPLVDLWRQLSVGLKRPGFKPSNSFNPHLTIAYEDGRIIPETPLERPIRWTVTEFALISSLFGASEHERHGTWTVT